MQRRIFLTMLVKSAACVFLMYPYRATLGLGKSAVTDELALILANRFHEKESARIIGLEYMRAAAAERDVALLVDRIFSGNADYRAEFAAADNKRRQEILSRQKCEDFEQGRVVKIQQWILSKTEARLCALAALL